MDLKRKEKEMKKKVDLGEVLKDLEATAQHLPEKRKQKMLDLLGSIDFIGLGVKVPEKYHRIIIEYHVERGEYTLALAFAKKVGIKDGLEEIKQKSVEDMPGRIWNRCY